MSKKTLCGYVARLDYSPDTMALIRTLKKSLNKDSYTLDYKYSGKRELGSYTTKKENAESVRIYIKPTPEFQDLSSSHRSCDNEIRMLQEQNIGLYKIVNSVEKISANLKKAETKLKILNAVFKNNEEYQEIISLLNDLEEKN